MSKEPNDFTKEEKTEIALKAVSGGEQEINQLAGKHGVSAEVIKTWIRETGVASVENSDEEHIEEVSLEASDSFIESVSFGATHDILNYPRLTFWVGFGTAVFVIIVLAIMNIYDYTFSGVAQQSSEQSLYYEINQMNQQSQAKLETFGVVDPEEGVYHIPVDSAISIMVQETD